MYNDNSNLLSLHITRSFLVLEVEVTQYYLFNYKITISTEFLGSPVLESYRPTLRYSGLVCTVYLTGRSFPPDSIKTGGEHNRVSDVWI